MVSRILLKLVDEAIIPAILVLAAKILGLAAIVWLFNLSWQLSTSPTLPAVTFESQAQLLTANSYSNLIMFGVVAAGLFWILARAHTFHDTHISPSMALRLLSWGATALMVNTFEAYSQAVVWLSYLWLTFFLIVLHTIFALNYTWVAFVCFVLSIFLTWLFVVDVEREIRR